MHASHRLGACLQVLREVIAISERSEVVIDIACQAADVRMQGKVPLAALNEVPRLFEGQLQRAALIAPRQTAGVIPVKVRCDHCVYLVRVDAQALEIEQQAFRLSQHNLAYPRVAELSPDPGLAVDD